MDQLIGGDDDHWMCGRSSTDDTHVCRVLYSRQSNRRQGDPFDGRPV